MTAQHHPQDAGRPDGGDDGAQNGTRHRRLGKWLTAAALAGMLGVGAAAAAGTFGLYGHSGGTDAPAKRPSPVTAAQTLPASAPERVVIRSIGVDAPLDTVGLQTNGEMEAPSFDKPMDAAWYRLGPTPGEEGAAAIVGHLDTSTTPRAVFFRLPQLKKGAEIDVERADHVTAVFAVDKVETFQKDSFPTEQVYGDTDGKAELRVITCGGALTAQRHWDSNVVVFAHLTGRA
ncbi:class F sortase [Streptomyces erythrochromogenes]|uniref:class F sortase n=1 Tax=Streptomyces erythrochromogenes TaxID=285574 RepID=UPI00341EAAC9